jgi:hypothetical protein
MIKFVSPSGWEFDRQIVVPVKVSSRGLIGNDRRDFLKTASHAFLPHVDNYKFASDEIPVHLIALGASEAYGPNRNGDGFKEATCKKYHDTFVKLAKFFRNHKNKPERGDPFYGYVKASAYNDDMRRVELLCALNANKAAADRNGGLVADTEVEKIARGEDFPVSMACRVPNDICSFCKHAAKTRDEYCTSEKCAAGGCRHNLSRLVKVGGDLHHLHVDNPDPAWFDISRVFRPADRIAYGAKADYFTKAASDDGIFDLQDCIKMSCNSTAPLDVILYQSGQHGFWSEKTASQIRLGYALATVEKASALPDTLLAGIATQAFPIEKLAAFGTPTCDRQLAALADRCIFLSLADYGRLSARSTHVKAAQNVLPSIYGTMATDESLPLRIEQSPSVLLDKVATFKDDLLATSLVKDFSFYKESVYLRSMLGCCRESRIPKIGKHEKLAACNFESKALAEDYAMYKLAALWRSAAHNPNFPLTVRFAVCQNQLFSV